MSRCSIILSLFILLISACSGKQNDPILKDEDKILGVWVITPLGPISRPADTLYFTKKDGAYKLSFECYGAPAINWPSRAETPYRFENGKLSYLNYYDPTNGFIVASSFEWITPGKEFQIFRRHLLLYMSAEYTVRYTKIR
jgi:hypothetical protein